MRRANMVLLLALAVGFLMLASDAVAVKKRCTSKKIPTLGACDPKTCDQNAKKDSVADGFRCPYAACIIQGRCVAGSCQRIICEK
ncbi:hypothetical protein BDA96_10G026500 [Sorghum bicolor]|uniref:Uncharacterized protein n=2 Tax=Sorghum bicolor TaxID=4558 RepID=A0A921TZL1_SORBI|nr:hypothetical protein BDA96_10G026500 [Sorghum bicolor]KXG19203.1 hypothetical protein SORBI_3010G022900 [Sorghum bicolor]